MCEGQSPARSNTAVRRIVCNSRNADPFMGSAIWNLSDDIDGLHGGDRRMGHCRSLGAMNMVETMV